jgi:hypothetical protein
LDPNDRLSGLPTTLVCRALRPLSFVSEQMLAVVTGGHDCDSDDHEDHHPGA